LKADKGFRLPSTRDLKGICFAPRDEFCFWEKPEKGVVVRENVKIHLPQPVVSLMDYNSLEASQVYSGLRGGNVDPDAQYIDYWNHLLVKEGVFYIEELDELRYIYKNFWYMVKYNRKGWLKQCYMRHDKKCTFNYTSKFTFERNILRKDNEVPFCVEGYFFFITVEELFDWIEYYRIPGKEYGIGECESDETLAYALLLNQVFGIEKRSVRARITPDEVKSTLCKIALELEMFVPREKHGDSEEDSDEEDRRILNLFRSDLASIEKAQRAEEEYEEKMIEFKTKQSLFNVDFGELEAMLTEEDDFPDSDDDRRDNTYESEDELPYESGLHKYNDEFASLVEMGIIEPEDDNISEVSDADSENMAPNRLTALEELGIDLIDPSRDNTFQPQLRRICMVWDPGGGNRPLRLRGAPNRRNWAT
jgi:hypothetical protein